MWNDREIRGKKWHETLNFVSLSFECMNCLPHFQLQNCIHGQHRNTHIAITAQFLLEYVFPAKQMKISLYQSLIIIQIGVFDIGILVFQHEVGP